MCLCLWIISLQNLVAVFDKLYYKNMNWGWKWHNDFRNGFLDLKNWGKWYYKRLYSKQERIYDDIFVWCHIGFCASWPPGGHYKLFVMVFDIHLPIANTVPECKNLSPSARFLSIPSVLFAGDILFSFTLVLTASYESQYRYMCRRIFSNIMPVQNSVHK